MVRSAQGEKVKLAEYDMSIYHTDDLGITESRIAVSAMGVQASQRRPNVRCYYRPTIVEMACNIERIPHTQPGTPVQANSRTKDALLSTVDQSYITPLL